MLNILAFGILGPQALVHAGIGTVIYLTVRLHAHKKRIAAEFKVVKRVINQLLVNSAGLLLPFALQITFARCLHVGVGAARGYKQDTKAKNQEKG